MDLKEGDILKYYSPIGNRTIYCKIKKRLPRAHHYHCYYLYNKPKPKDWIEARILMFYFPPDKEKYITILSSDSPQEICKCSIQTLMITGCKCGYIKRNRN